MNPSPLIGFFALCVISCVAALLMGALVLGLVFAAAGMLCHGCTRHDEGCASSPAPPRPPRPVITYQERTNACEPWISLQRGQIATVPWPHTLQVHLPAGVCLQVLEATSERVRIIAV